MKKRNIIMQNKKAFYTMTLKQYSDDSKGFLDLLNDIIATTNESFQVYGKEWGNHVKYELNSSSKINPAFYALISKHCNTSSMSIVRKDGWKVMEDQLVEATENNDDYNTSIKKGVLPRHWINVNDIYPNYENKGVIAIYHFDEERMLISDIRHRWAADISQAYRMILEFANSDKPLKDHEFNAFKYIIGELVANTFQHAFPNGVTASSSLGVFLNEETREMTFVVTDNGLSIAKSVMDAKKIKKPNQAIVWALGKGNTTKKEGKLGGRGLYRVDEIVKKAKGTLVIRANKALYKREGDFSESKNVFYSVIGTSVYVSINLNNIPSDIISMSEEIREETKGTFDE